VRRQILVYGQAVVAPDSRRLTQDVYSTYQADQREFFDRLITEDFDTYADPAWDRRRRLEVDRLFRHVSPRRILDVGCGVGFHDREMAERPGVVEVVGIDYSDRSVETAEREFPHANVSRRMADIFEMEDGDFDLCVSFQVIEHVNDARRFLAACRRQVRSGGWVAVVTPNRLRSDNRLARLRRKPLLLIDPQHFREFTPAEMRAEAAGLKLEPIATEGFGMSLTAPKIGRQVVPRRAGELLGPLLPATADGFLQVWRATP
jgi:2-polyprenyl-3-methyl-5-hydroxy-6-metoxy-1,4-benzoquinol methylase